MSEKASRTVFVGNIPYGQSEEQIKEICGTVGQVLSFRPIYDNDSGRPRGYGFVEYADADAAASAVRNLNGYKIDGRELRVDFSKRSDEDGGGGSGGGGGGANSNSNHNHHASNSANNLSHSSGAAAPANGIGPLPPGTELPPGMTCVDSISTTLATLPPPQLLDILSQMKGLVTGDPAKATELLRAAPQLSYAIFQALLLMGLVDSQLIQQVVQQAAGGGASGGMPDAGMTGMMGGGAPPPPPGHQFQPQQQQQQPQQQQQNYGQTPPVHQGPYPPPPQQQQQQQGPPVLPPGQEELLKQVLMLPESEIQKLAPSERDQLMALRRQYAGVRF